jgi:hypothetical protein
MSTLFSLGGLPTHPQNPHSWRTSLSRSLATLLRPVRLVRPLQEHKVPACVARKVIEARKPPLQAKVVTIGEYLIFLSQISRDTVP